MNPIKLTKLKKMVIREKFVYRAGEYTYSFQNSQIIKNFGKDISNDEITLEPVKIKVIY